MRITKNYFCIPPDSRDQHLPMVPGYAAPFKACDIRGVGIHRVDEPYEIQRVSAPWHIALITLRGRAEFECKGENGTIKTNDVWVGPADTPYSYRAVGPWKFISAALFKTDSFVHLENEATLKRRIYDLSHLSNAVEAYLSEAALAQNEDSVTAEALARYVSNAIARELRPVECHKSSRVRLELNQLWERVNSLPGNSWRLPELAAGMNVSARQFQRIMRDNYGMTAEKMLIRIRMDHARELLIATDLTMAMIAEQVGYQSVYAFSKAFSRYFGEAPGHFRKSN